MKQNKEPKRYDFTRKPKKPSPLWMWIANKFAIDPRLKGRPLTINKINMEGIKPPYLLLATHASMLDFPVMYKAVAPGSCGSSGASASANLSRICTSSRT